MRKNVRLSRDGKKEEKKGQAHRVRWWWAVWYFETILYKWVVKTITSGRKRWNYIWSARDSFTVTLSLSDSHPCVLPNDFSPSSFIMTLLSATVTLCLEKYLRAAKKVWFFFPCKKLVYFFSLGCRDKNFSGKLIRLPKFRWHLRIKGLKLLMMVLEILREISCHKEAA